MSVGLGAAAAAVAAVRTATATVLENVVAVLRQVFAGGDPQAPDLRVAVHAAPHRLARGVVDKGEHVAIADGTPADNELAVFEAQIVHARTLSPATPARQSGHVEATALPQGFVDDDRHRVGQIQAAHVLGEHGDAVQLEVGGVADIVRQATRLAAEHEIER